MLYDFNPFKHTQTRFMGRHTVSFGECNGASENNGLSALLGCSASLFLLIFCVLILSVTEQHIEISMVVELFPFSVLSALDL